MGVTSLAVGIAGVSWADSPDPVQNTAVGVIIPNPAGAPAGAVTVRVSGKWTWPTHRSDCNTNRFAAGYAVDWNDPSDPGPVTLTGKDKQGNPISADPGTTKTTAWSTPDPYTHYNGGKSDDETGGPRCGVYANPPGYNSGNWGPIEHTYVNPPANITACVVTYDLHDGNAVHPVTGEAGVTSKDTLTSAGDNSIQSNGSTPGGNQCAAIVIPKPLSLEILKTNNADPSNGYSQDETAATANETVPFRVSIKNTSTVDSVKLTSITDSIVGVGDLEVCKTGAPGNNLIGSVLAPNQVVVCDFSLPTYSPAAGGHKDNTVVVKGEDATGRSVTSNPSTSIVRTADAKPDLVVDKTGPATALQDQTVKYSIAVDNVGGATQTGPIKVVDTLPAGESYVSATGNGVTCNPAAGANGTTVVTCSLPNAAGLAPNDAPLSFDVTVKFAANAAGHYTDCATLDNGNKDCVTTSVIPVSVTKTNNADGKPGYNKAETAPAANQDVPFQVQVHNDGTLPIVIKTLTDEWPGQAAKPICANLIGTTVAAGGSSAVCDFTEASYSPADGASKTNTVHVVAYEAGVPANTATAQDQSTVVTDVAKSPQLIVDKDGPTTTVVAGSEQVYTIKVTNNGTAAQTARFTVTDTLPDAETFVSASRTPACTATAGPGQVVSCDFDEDLAVNQSISFTVRVRFAETASGNFEDCARVENSKDCVTTPVTPVLTLRVDKTNNANQDLVFSDVEEAKTAGQNVVFNALITNLSKVDVQIDSITDKIGNVTSAVCAANNGNVLAANGGNVLCAFTLNGYAPATGSAVDLVTANAHEVKNAKNTVSASDDSTVLAPGGAPALVVLKTGPASAMPGSQAEYTIKVSNKGTATANPPLTVTDTLPAGETFVSSSLGNACIPTAGPGQTVVTCTLSQALAAGADTSFTVRVQFSASATGTLTDCAAIGTSQSCVPTTMPDLKIVKTGAAIARPGDTLPYTLTISNTGTVPASGFTVTDTLPAGLTLGTITQGSFTCLAGGAINCTFPGTLAPGASTTLSFNATLANPYTLPSVINTAVVGPTDETPGDNTSTWPTPVEQPGKVNPDLGIDKTGPAFAEPGKDVVYTLTVTNTGTVDASGFTVTDPLTVDLIFKSASGTGFTCTGPGVNCTYPGVLKPGEKAVVTVTATLVPTFEGETVINTATVGPNDDTPGDNTDTYITPVRQPAVIEPDLGIVKTGPASVSPGETYSYTLTVRNTGLVSATGFTVSDELPQELTLVSISGDGFTCTESAVSCTYNGTLMPAGTASVTVTVKLASSFTGTSVKNVAVVAPTDGTPDDNRSEITTPVDQPSPPLPFTGSNTYQLLLSALALLSVGAALVLAGRRRHRWEV